MRVKQSNEREFCGIPDQNNDGWWEQALAPD